MQKLLARWWFRILLFVVIVVVVNLTAGIFFIGSIVSILLMTIIATVTSILLQSRRAGSKYNAFGLQFDRFTLIDILKGLLIVIATNLIFIGLGLLAGYEYNLSENLGEYSYSTLYYYMFYLFVMAFFEEIMFRGIIFQSLRERFGDIISILVMSVFFSLAHYFNPNVSTMGLINIIVAGVFLSVLYITTESLWLPISFHFFWNLNQQLILGSNISGNDFGISVMNLTAIGDGASWLFGNSFGIEEGLLTTVLLIFLTFISFKTNKQNPFIMATKFNIRNEESKLLEQ